MPRPNRLEFPTLPEPTRAEKCAQAIVMVFICAVGLLVLAALTLAVIGLASVVFGS